MRYNWIDLLMESQRPSVASKTNSTSGPSSTRDTSGDEIIRSPLNCTREINFSVHLPSLTPFTNISFFFCLKSYISKSTRYRNISTYTPINNLLL
uniref:p2C05 n=1 Tax=Arundo donax TaxID=35708 RepID=A0A0A9DCF9_ARUDO